MLSGIIRGKNSPAVVYSSSGYGRQLSPKQREDLDAAIKEARSKGYLVGVQVKRAKPTGGNASDRGTIIGYPNDSQMGFHLGTPCPITVEWNSPHQKWSMSYALSDIEIVRETDDKKLEQEIEDYQNQFQYF